MQVWEILTDLPTNPVIERTLSHLEGDNEGSRPNWSVLLNPRSMYKTLYCLKIIDALMSPPSDTATATASASADPASASSSAAPAVCILPNEK